MKKRVLSALLALCMGCSLVSTAWAEGTDATSGAPEPASQTLNLDNEQSGNESGADSTSASSDSTDSTSAFSDSTSSSSSAASDATSGEGDEGAASSDSTAASDSTSSSSSASSDSSDSDADEQDAASSDVTGDESSTGTEEENDPAVEQPSASPEPVPSQPNRAPAAPQASDDGISTFAVSGETGTDSNRYNTGNNYSNPKKDTYTYNLIRGEDTSEDITIHVFDYDTAPINQDNGSQRPFRFSEDPGEESDYHWDDINKYHKGTNGTMTGIVQDRLQGGYPVLSTGQSLDYLFTTNEGVSGKHNHLNANNLFQIDSEGYYYFDSSENFATLALDDSNDFWLYRDVANTGDNSVPQFLPFNTMDRESTWQSEGWFGGSWQSSDGIAEDGTNYHFGMTVEFDFLMPEGGTLEDGSPMTFEFTGDDDVWVFIDDCLVLDLGGIHDPISGTINFATGQVTRSGNVVGNLTNMVDEWDGAAYQTHTLKFFYLERGGGGSNCQLKFNMPTIPKNAVAVNKRVTGDVPENAPEAYTMQFVPESWPTTEPGEEIKAGTSEETAKTLSASDAAFTVTPGTPTYIYNVPSNLAYQIKEIEVDEGVSVSFNGTAATPDQGVAVSEMFGAGTRSVTVTNNYPLEPVTPEHRKYVERNEDGTYDLTLDVTGAVDTTQGEAQKIDILYVLDNSTSMDDPVSYSDQTRRLTAAKNAITVLETALGTDEIDVQHAMVIFSSEDYTVEGGWWNEWQDEDVDNTYTYQTWTSEPLNLTAISTTDHANGTNYQAGIQEAKTVLQQGTRDDAIQVVIFISDGEPNRPGNGLSAAQTEISDLNADRLYAIGVSDEVGLDTLTSLIDSAKNIPGENKNAYSSSNSEQLAEIFRGLAAEILSADVSNVTITDTLSQYAQLTENATFTVNVEGADGVTISPSSFSIAQAREGASGRISYTRDGEPVSVGFTVTYTPAVAATATEAAVPASFTLDFDDDSYTLENGWTYSITTQIEPTDAAYDCYRDNGYPNTGEADTDAPGVAEENYISEGKQGFFSNQSAILTYNSADHTGITVDYNNPVIQIPEPTTTTLTLSKTFHGLTDDEVNYLIFREDGFGYDVNYCQPEVRDDAIISNNTITRVFATYMADADAVKGVTLRTGEAVTGGGDFKVVANDYLTVGNNAVTGIQNIVDNYDSEYTNEQTGASLVKDSNSGDWTLTIVMDVPVASDGYYYTVFEQHGEVPGYAKLDDSNVEYQISGEIQFIDDNGGLVSLTDANDDGTGKFVDVGVAAANNVYIDMDTEITNVQVEVEDAQYAHQNGDSNIYTISGEEAGVHNGSFSRLHITGATTIHFDNYYTGDLVVTKAVTGIPTSDEAAQTELADKEFTLEFTPVLIDQKPVVRGDLLEGREITYTITDANGTVTNPATQGNEFTTHMDNSGAFTVTIQAGQTITFKEIPAIQYTVTEQTTGVEYDLTDYTWQSVSYAETAANFNKGGVDHATDTYWNHNGMNGGDRVSYDVIGAATTGAETDQIVSVHSDIADPRPSQTLTVTNEYKHIDVTLTVSKTVLGNLGDKTKDFAFTLIVTPAEGQTLDYSAIAETIEITSLDEGETSQPTYTFTNGSVQFQMHSGQQMTVQLPYGCNYAVSEVTDGYSAQIDVTGDSDANQDGVNVSGTMDADIKVAYTNTMVVGVPTGLDRNNTPYTLMVTAAGVAGLALIGAVVNRRIRRRREE